MLSNESSDLAFELETYKRVELASAIILCVLSPVTVLSNLLLLTAIYRDPLRCFRTPITFFIVGLALADFITGSTVEPFFVLYYIAKYMSSDGKPGKGFELLHRMAGKISTIAISTSFFVVLALSLSQFIAVSYPHQYKQIVSRSRVVLCLVASCVYFTLFSLLELTGVNPRTYLTLDLILHSTLISLVLVVTHCLLYCSFKQHLVRRKSLRGQSAFLQDALEKKKIRRKRSQRQFTIFTFYLAGILLASASFHTMAIYIFLFYEPRRPAEGIKISLCLRLSDLMLFVKVAVDCFIYAWRLPNYRQALYITLMELRGVNHTDQRRGGATPEQPSCRYNHRTLSSVLNVPQSGPRE